MKSKNIVTFFEKYFETFTYFYRRLRHRILFRMLLSVGVGILDGFGLAMFIPLLSIAGDQGDTSKSDLGKLEFLVNFFENVGIPLTIYSVLIIMASFFCLKGVFKYSSEIYNLKVKQFFIRKVRKNLSDSLSKVNYKFFMASDSGKIQNSLTGETVKLLQAFQMYFYSFENIVLTFVYVLFAFTVDWKFAIIISIAGASSQILFRNIYKSTKQYSKKVTAGANDYQGLIIQFVNNFKYLKATGFLKEFRKKITTSIDDIQSNNYVVGKLNAVANSMREPILMLIICAVILIQIIIFEGSIGTILVSLMFFYRALTSLMLVQTSYNSFLSNSGSLLQLKSFQEELDQSKEVPGNIEFHSLDKCIELTNLDFYYGDNKILHNINFSISKNESIALVGESGSGKSTLVNLICGLMPIASGNLLYDDKNILDLNLTTLQKKIGYITQEPVIFADTVFNNITLWDSKNKDNLQRFQEALNKASLCTLVNSELEEKEDTVLGLNGVNLSGGQKQRISIARELYKNVDILVLDEATSALDSETERDIQNSIDKLHGKYTIIMIAHRLATVKSADRIVVMDKGAIKEVGPYNELKNSSSIFKRMVKLQEL